jgi:hypothetical protein
MLHIQSKLDRTKQVARTGSVTEPVLSSTRITSAAGKRNLSEQMFTPSRRIL